MSLKFKVDCTLYGNSVGIYAHQLGKYRFELGESPSLGGCRIKRSLNQPRQSRADGSLDPDIFCFYLENEEDRTKFNKGKIVHLIP